jgi:hypothetical protein
MHVLGARSKTDAVVLALTEVIRRQRIEELKQLQAEIELHVCLAASRRRLGRPERPSGPRRPPLRPVS